MENIPDIEEAIAEICPLRIEYLIVSSKCDTIINQLKETKSYPEYIKEIQIFQDNFCKSYWKGVKLSEDSMWKLIVYHEKYIDMIHTFIDIMLAYDDICQKLKGKVSRKDINNIRQFQKYFQDSYHRLCRLQSSDEQIKELFDFYKKDTIDISNYFKKYISSHQMISDIDYTQNGK